MKIYFSHTGNNQLLPEIEIVASTLSELIDKINQLPNFIGIKNEICLSGKLLSSIRIFANVEAKIESVYDIHTRKYYETDNTIELTDINSPLDASIENILISLFNPQLLLSMINACQTEQDKEFSYTDELGRVKTKKYKPIIDNIDFSVNVMEEPIYGFRNGESTLEDLKIVRGDSAYISIDGESFDKCNSKLLPEDLVNAIRKIWELPDGAGTLRLFQEDALFFIMSRLLKTPYPKETQLLLSMPTGGGKTEAFMIPLLANVYQEKLNGAPKGVKSIIIYPTNALANDQAIRFVELIYKINCQLSQSGVPKTNYITIGVLSGDTPNRSSDLANESLIKICPRCGKSDKWKNEDNSIICKNELHSGLTCGTRMDFCRLTKEDIITNPPDVLITNPDIINFSLHSPKYLKIFKTKIESIVFDEVHIYQGVFGCHIAHLLRRLEETVGHKPLYIGMSATIGNAKQLAALLFDEPTENIRYIRNENNKYINSDTVIKTRYHALVKPYLRDTVTTHSGEKKNKYVRTMSVAGSIGMFVGHLITDSHFRKSIIFTNYRSDADDLAGYLQERERLDVKEYFTSILYKLQTRKNLSTEEIEICEYINRWFEEIINKTKTINGEVVVGWNRGGLEKVERINSIHSFSRNNILADVNSDASLPIDVMVATKSLEVGIDIGDVTTVINSSAPFTINEYVQRVGRAGRKKESLAITVINPENAIDSHLEKHFVDYVHPTENKFEDAPIIINNEIIVNRHIAARVIDYINEKFVELHPDDDHVSLTVRNIINDIKIIKDGRILQLGPQCSEQEAADYANRVYELIFDRKFGSISISERLLEFLKREAEILGTKECELTVENFRKWILDVIFVWHSHLKQNSKDKWQIDKNITGYGDALMPELTPALRGSGATVSLYIGDSETAIDVVTRQTAFSSMPLSAASISTTKSGISTFKIEDDKGESDTEAEKQIRREICKDIPGRPVLEYFSRKLEDFPYSDDLIDVATNLSVLVPKKLRVSYFPSRFYCSNCKKGLVPEQDCEERKNGVYCKACGRKAQQLHKVFICEDDECGNIFDPPVPKMCINPDCQTVKKAFEIYVRNGYRESVEMQKLFKFRLTKDMEWVCSECGTRINFASYRRLMMGNSSTVQKKIGALTADDKRTIEGMCYRAKVFPERLNFKEPIRASYSCNISGHKNRKAVGAPRVRSVAYSYIGEKIVLGNKVGLCDDVNCENVRIQFNKGYVVQLAKDFMRRFSSGTGDQETYTLKTEKIFNDKYWGNYYESHLAWLKYGEKIDEFVAAHVYSCDGNCSACDKMSSLDLGNLMRPQRALEDYNFDQVNGIPKKPDHRGKFCEIAKDNCCTKQCCVKSDLQETCTDFQTNEFVRYLIVHTIKHSILWALPKYAGVNVSEIKAEIYPNDNRAYADLVLIDSNEGGSGAILLVQKHWEEIWKFAEELIMMTANNEANIILPHTCSRYNADLCPFLAKEFFDYIRN